MTVHPFISLFADELTVTARLNVTRLASGMRLTGNGLVYGARVHIDGIATSAGRHVSLAVTGS
jgi:hypothetical protein